MTENRTLVNKLLEIIQNQRNDALNKLALMEANNILLNVENVELRKQLIEEKEEVL